MKQKLRPCLVVTIVTVAEFLAAPAHAQPMPRENVIDVPAICDIFPEMIRAWRRAFNDTEMPFGILSLCTDGYPQTRDNYCEKMFNAGIAIRAAQYQTFLDFHDAGDQQIGFVSTYDLRRRWYHPQLKIPAGERIARWALATQYGFSKQVD